jgi:hypothetical protein
MGKKWWISKIIESWTLGSTQQVEHKFLGGFPFSKAVWPLLKVTGAPDDHQWAKQIIIWDEWNKLSLKTDESLSVMLRTSGNFTWVSSEHFERQSIVLTWEEKKNCVNTCWDLQERLERNPKLHVQLLSFPRTQDGIRMKEISCYHHDWCNTAPQDSLAKFQTVHFTKCFKWWHNHWAHSVTYQVHYFGGSKINYKVSTVIKK